ncbi:hypothetical protein JHL22_04935 [Advenella sp. WQ 585]|uniref:Tip attachment protein J domain-containing protein n=1 Tax=Advenella mandrilli TaxID=2800330 RepID=A0ABS1EDY8_9BURK|nr:hypothetical protein [Advenella mandrilli]MBK1780555.1 hypothetical protein [Advenella mandrilli]
MREPVTFVEIDQDFCAHSFGVSPCAAALGPQGKCFNTLKTCQDEVNFNPEPLTLTFSLKGQANTPGIYAIPSVMSVSTAPTVINPGGGSRQSGPLGMRASLTVSFEDAPHSDNLVDKYAGTRGYDALNRGTFWGKWLARAPYYNNRIIRVRDGYAGQPLAEMTTRTYIIDKITGPDRGKVTVTAKDMLKLADDDKSQAPKPSNGELIIDYTAEDPITELRVTGADAGEYPAPGVVRVGRELMSYTGVTTVSETEIELTGISRAVMGSEQKQHKLKDRVQLCLQYDGIRVDEIIYDLLTEYGSVDPDWIDYDAWQAEAGLWLQQYTFTGIITEPTGVTSLISELAEQSLTHVWWDERQQKILLETIKPPIYEDVPRINDSKNIISDSVKIKVEPKARVSQVWVFFGQIDPTEKITNEENFARLRVRADLEAESDQQYGDSNIRKIYSRWIETEAQAINITTRLLNRFRDMPKYVTLELDSKDRHFWTGDIVDMTHIAIVDFTGEPQETRYQIISAEEVEPGHKTEYVLEKYEYEIGLLFGRWMANNAPDYDGATEEQRFLGMWWGNVNGEQEDGKKYLWS